jgi:hypothetical protein
VVSTPLKNISQWEGLSHISWKIAFMFETTNQMNSCCFQKKTPPGASQFLSPLCRFQVLELLELENPIPWACLGWETST